MDDRELRKKQAIMHKNFFDKCQFAIDNGFYLEAIFLEYAAIEGRLEIICGVLGLPCNKDLTPQKRKDIKISKRIECINKVKNANEELFKNTNLDSCFFTNKGVLKKWITDRNTYIHGLYKNAEKYDGRKSKCRELAVSGKEYARLLYNENSRLKRMKKNRPELFAAISCPEKTHCFDK